LQSILKGFQQLKIYMKNIFCFRVFYYGKCSLFPTYYIMRQSNKISFVGIVLVGIVKINPVHCIFGFVEDNGSKISHNLDV